MTDKELEANDHFREAVRRLEIARELPTQTERCRQREIANELLRLCDAVAKS